MADPKVLTFVCPECGHHAAPVGFAIDVDSKHYAALLADMPPLVARAVMSYLSLFSPAKRKLTAPRARTLLQELAPLIKAERINRRGRDWVTPHTAWIAGIDDMLSRRDKLDLPLQSHGYLLDVLTSQADRIERVDENQREQQLRNGAQAVIRRADETLDQTRSVIEQAVRSVARPIETADERMARARRELGNAAKRPMPAPASLHGMTPEQVRDMARAAAAGHTVSLPAVKDLPGRDPEPGQ